MKVLKFGGTSVGSPDRIKKLLDIIDPNERQIVVLSAVSGTTNSLLEISQAYLAADKTKAAGLTALLKAKYDSFVKELFSSEEGLENGNNLIDYHFNLIS
jgi:aspartate kinase